MTAQVGWCCVVVVLALLLSLCAGQSFLNRNTSFIDNGDVCDSWDDPTFPPDTTCAITVPAGGLAAALAACASDDILILTLEPGFADDGSFVFPDVKSISLISPTGDATIRGDKHVVVGNFTTLAFSGIRFDGEGTKEFLFDPPLRSNNLFLTNGTLITRFYGPKAILMEAGDDNTNITMLDSGCYDVWSSCLAWSGVNSENIQNNTFAQCGGTPDSCLFAKNHWASLGRNIFFRNTCYLLWNELPPRCINWVDPAGFVRCNGQNVECLDLTATQLADDCPLVDFTYYDNATASMKTIQVYQEFCRRYSPCECEEVTFRDASNFTVEDVVARVGDVIYPTITLECQAGSTPIGGGSVVTTSAIQFQDGGFEGSWPTSPPYWNLNSPVTLIYNRTNILQNPSLFPSELVNNGVPYLGQNFIYCQGGLDQSFSQSVNLPDNSTYSVGFFARRRDDKRSNLKNLRMELYLDSTEVGAIEGTELFDMLVQDKTYYELRFPLFPAVSGTHNIRIRCNFVDDGGGGFFLIDNVFSNPGGFQLVSFPPGLGLGPPPNQNPLDYIASPLTADATLALPACPACKPAPDRPPNIPCNYGVAPNFTCFPTITVDGKYVCLTPTLPTFGAGLQLEDPSFENAINTTLYPQVWSQSGSPSITDTRITLTPFPPRTGVFVMYCQNGDDCYISQSRNNTEAGLYVLEFWLRATLASIANLNGKYIELQLDGSPVATISGLSLQSILLDDTAYYLVQFPSKFIDVGVHIITLRINMIGGSGNADLLLDDIEFSTAVATPSMSVTPSRSPTPSPSPSFAPGNVTIPCGGILLNTTWCDGQLVQYGNVSLCNGTLTTEEFCNQCAGVTTPINWCNGTLTLVPVCTGFYVNATCVNGTLRNDTLCSGTLVPGIWCNTTSNATVYDPKLLRCVENDVFLGNTVFDGGCVLPLDMIVEENNQTFTALDCIVYGACTIPESYTVKVNGFTLTCASSTFGMMSCDCSASVLLNNTLTRVIDPGAACYEFDKKPRTIANWFIRENDAMQLPWGAITRRMECDTIIASSLADGNYFDERCVGRELGVKQDNRFFAPLPVAGGGGGFEQATRILMDALPEYEQVCERDCPIFNPEDPGDAQVCLVNQAANDLDPTYYQSIQDALDSSECRKQNSIIVVISTVQFYEEDLQFSGDYVRLFSTTNATIIGNHRVTGNVNLLFLRGLNWIHQGKNGEPVIDIDDAGDLKNFTAYNNYIGGGGAKNAAFLNNRKRLIQDVDIRYNTFDEFSTSVLRVTAARIVFSHNTIRDCSGRLVQNRYTEWFQCQHNVHIRSRGAKNIQKPSYFEFRYIGARGSEPCQQEGLCLFRDNVQIEEDPENEPDYKETCAEFIKGALWVDNVRDNVCVKARTGMRVRKVSLFASATESIGTTEGYLELFQANNPEYRPSRTRVKSGGEDFKVDGYVSGVRLGGKRCVYPECAPPEMWPRFCIANLNFDSWNSRQHGFQTFTNVTEASFYCPLNLIEIMVFGGAKIIPERWNVRRPLSDELRFPLKDTTSIKQIVKGQRPVPSRFTIQGQDVQLDRVGYFADLLDRNRTYGFGEVERIKVGETTVCACPGKDVFSQQSVFFAVPTCSILLATPSIDLCATNVTLPDLPNVTLVSCYQAPLQCVSLGTTGYYNVIWSYDQQSCSVTATYTYTYENGTGNFSSIVTGQGALTYTESPTYPLENCIVDIYPIRETVVSQSALNIQRRPSYYSVGSRYRALNITIQHLDFYMHYGRVYDQNELGQDLLTNEGGNFEMRTLDVEFNGLGVIAPGPVVAYRFFHGVDYAEEFGRKKENKRPDISGVAFVQNCSFVNFLYYETALGNTPGTPLDEDEAFNFPWPDGFYYEAINRRIGDSMTITFEGNRGADIDRRFFDIRFANQTYIRNNTGVRIGGRSIQSTAAWYIEPCAESPNWEIVLVGNNISQKRAVNYPFLASAYKPSLTTNGWIAVAGDDIYDHCVGMNFTIDQCIDEDWTCCPRIEIVDNVVCGLPIGIRFVGRRETVTQWLINGLPDGQIIKFEDDKSGLREVSFANGANIDGTICDLVIGEPFLDYDKNYVCCQETCAPANPADCRINSTDPRINPTHPWWRVFWFDDINQSLEECQARGRRILLEQPSDGSPYDIRINATVTEPVILQYRELYTFPVLITVLSTSPINTPSPQLSIPISFSDAALTPMEFELIPGVLTLNTTDIEVRVALQLPYNTSVGVPTLTPNGFTADIDVTFTFLAPDVSTALPDCIFFNLTYMSPVQFVTAYQGGYSAFVTVDFNFTNGKACLLQRTGMVLKGVGDPTVRCDGHSVAGQYITLRDFRLLHGDPCLDNSIGPDCPCLPLLQPGSTVTTSGVLPDTSSVTLHRRRLDEERVFWMINRTLVENLPVLAESDDLGAGELPFQYGRATWHQNDTDAAPGLRFFQMIFDGDENELYERIALDGYYHELLDVELTTFQNYALSNPGFVLRPTGSRLAGCCGGANCTRMEMIFTRLLFIGDAPKTMSGSLITARNMTTYQLTGNEAEDVCCKDTVHPYPGAFYMRTCPGSEQPVVISANNVARTSGGSKPEQQRVQRPPIQGCVGSNCSLSDCYWSIYHLHGFPSTGITVWYNAQYFPANKTGSEKGAPICMRVIDWPVPIPNLECRRPLYDLLVGAYNTFCDGSEFDLVRGMCEEDVCLAVSKGCDGSDSECKTARDNNQCLLSSQNRNYKCYWCNDGCIDDPLIPYLLFAIVLLVALMFLAVLFMARLCCFSSTAFRYETQIGDSGAFIPADPSHYETAIDAISQYSRAGPYLGSIGTTSDRADEVLPAEGGVDGPKPGRRRRGPAKISRAEAIQSLFDDGSGSGASAAGFSSK